MKAIPPMPELDDLAHLSRRLGAQIAYAQGGGGNTSLKDSSARMWIKASGIELATAEADKSFVPVDYKKTVSLLSQCKTEADYVECVGQSVIAEDATSNKRPSIETGFHALLGKVVMHSHSVWANLVNCALTGQKLVTDLFPNALWIPYETPGLPLTRRIQEYLKNQSDTEILFLQNHGVIVSAATTEDAWALHEDINQAIRARFSLSDSYPTADESFIADAQHILFPDQTVYLNHPILKNSKAGHETQQAYNFLRYTLIKLNLEPHFLPETESEALLNMEAEKYRQKVAQ